MNDFKLFLNFGAVVKIKRFYRDDLYKLCKLFLKLGFMKEDIIYFLATEGIVEKYDKNNLKMNKVQLLDTLKTMNKEQILSLLEESYCDTTFWHYVDINEGRVNEICLEYSMEKGFTLGTEKEYKDYDETIKVLNVDDLVVACDMEEEFNIGYIQTTFKDEMEEKHKELIEELDYFCEWYEWSLVKYSNGLYNILDTQTDELVGYFSNRNGENGTLRECIERVYGRMVDYFTDEQEHEDLDYVERTMSTYIKLGKQYKLLSENQIKYKEEWLEEMKEDLKGE